VAARIAGQRREADHVLAGATLQAEFVELFWRDARKDRNRQHARRFAPEFGGALVRGLDRGRQHLRAAERVHGEQSDAGPHQRAHCGVHRARDVVQLDVEHVAPPRGFQALDERAAETVERFVSDLEHHVEPAQGIDQPLRTFQGWDVESDDERWHAAKLATAVHDPAT
jgi:hypothetical protein